MMQLSNNIIKEIVNNNYIHASILYRFGIEFYYYEEETLYQVCKKKGLDVNLIINKLDNFNLNDEKISIENYPLDLIIAYLKHSHYVFIKEKIPFISKIIDKLEFHDKFIKSEIEDLKFVFPLFVQDFIQHIYEEEDTLFNYIIEMVNCKKNGFKSLSKIFYQMDKTQLSSFAKEHEEHDDEMKGIRKIMKNYEINDNTPLQIKVLFFELETLEKELIQHAKIENEILFPKALKLEKEICKTVTKNVRLN